MSQGSDICYEVLRPNPEDTLDHLFPLNAHKIGWLFSGMCMVLAVILSFQLIMKHSEHYTRPSQQRYILRILLLVPIYSVTSWLSYIFYRHAPYYEMLRGMYEGFVISSFFLLLVNYIGDKPEEQRRAVLRRQGAKPIRLLVPLCCIVIPGSNRHFLQFLKYGILQYVVVKPLLSLIAMILFYFGIYCPESMGFNNARSYIAILNALAAIIALYSMLLFYVTMRPELAPHQPFLKFMSVKLVIFFCIAQSWFIGILTHSRLVKPTKYWTVNNISTGLNALLINFEMILFALLHFKAFPYHPYELIERPTTPWNTGLVDALSIVDLGREISHGAKYFWHVIIRKNHEWGTDEHDEKKDSRPGQTAMRLEFFSTPKTTLVEKEREVQLGTAGRVAFTTAATVDLTRLVGDDDQEQQVGFSNEGLEEGNRLVTPGRVHMRQ